MRRCLLIILCSLFVAFGFAQQRSFTDKEHGGAENGFFGKIDDEVNVSPTGQLSYDIPIPAIPGTGGMKPSLSVAYNSSTKNGLAGYGFDLTGLSIISRVPSDRFHDYLSTAIDFTGHDHFALDGQRLLNYNYSTATETEYRTENNSFAKILAQGKSTNPTSFKVYTKSGLIYDYVSVAKALGKAESDSTLFWLVSKISDTKGNYIVVTYGGDASSSDFYPSRIDYTGNDSMGVTPYASVRFSYISNPYTPVTYVNGARVKRSKIISSIDLYMEEQPVRNFHFSYQVVNRKYQLSKITESTSDGESKNPTRLTWSNLDSFKVKNYNYSTTKLIHKATLTIGDFNGDGMADFIATPENDKAGWEGWKLFISHGTYFEEVASGTWVWEDDKVEQVVCGDFNADGYADVVVKRCHSGKWHNCDLYATSVDDKGKVTIGYDKCFLSLSKNYTIQPVELNGDGAADLFAWMENSQECKLIYSEQSGKILTPLKYTATYYGYEKWDRVEYGDFNGDGLTDVMNLHDKGNCIMYSNGAGTMSKQTKSTWPDKNHYLELGDFNGDGKTDMLLTGWKKDPNKDGWGHWCINYSKGDGTFTREYYANPFDARSKQLFIADLNGDGFDDFQAIDKTSTGYDMTQPQAYLSDGRGNFYQQVKGGNVYATDKWHFYVGDFNGDGKADFVCTSDWNNSNWDGYQLYLMPSDMHSLLTEIEDGMGNQTKISYKYLTDTTVFTRGKVNSYPLISIGSSWPVVSTVSTPDGIGGVSTVSYTYEDALFHNNGRGLLGFAKCHVLDEATNTLNTTEYTVDTWKYVIAPMHSLKTVNGKKIEECDYTYVVKTNYSASSYVSDIYTYVPATTHQRSYELNTGDVLKDVTTINEYDNFGNATKITVKDGNVETTTTNTFTNDTENWILGRLTASTVSKTNESGTITKSSSFEYDKISGLLTAETFAPENTLLGYQKTYVHDGFGNIVKSTESFLDNSSERVTLSTYDKRGRFLVSATNSLGFTESSTIDESTGLIASTTDKNGIVTHYVYDKFGRLVEQTTPISKSQNTTGWSAGMQDAPTNALYFTWSKVRGEAYTIQFYDCWGRQLRKVTESVGGKKVYVDQVYNRKGELVKISEPYFSNDQPCWTSNEYDDVGRIIAQIKPDGSKNKFQYFGLKTVTIDPLGHIDTKIYNLNGSLVSSIDDAGTSISYKYNAEGKCIETKGPRTTIRCSYDIAGNRVSMEDPDLGSSQDTYNAFGELINRLDNHGVTHYEYDAGGRLVFESRPDCIISTNYDKTWKGAISNVVSSGTIQTFYFYVYDSYGRVIQKNAIINHRTYEIAYTYNSANHIETITYPNNLKVRNIYDDSGVQTAVLDEGTGKAYWRLLALNARDQVEQEAYGNGLVTTYSYNPWTGDIVRVFTPGIQDWEYAFDRAGNLSARHDLRRNLYEDFIYDNLNRLCVVYQNGRLNLRTTYDAAGNITSKSDVGDYNYEDGSNKLASITNCKRAVASWDAIAYNSFDKIIQIVSRGIGMNLEYGPDKSRVMSDAQGVSTYYVDKLFEQKISRNGKISNTDYIFALGKAVAIVTQDSTVSVKFIHHDHLGSIQAYSDELGNLYQELSYDAWGVRRNPDTWTVYDVLASSNAYDAHGFGGHEHLDVFDMINMDGRMYDPVVGRFISADPFVQSPDFTQSLNRYAYCVNNPLSLIDPSGYNWFSKNWKSLLASTVGIAVSVITAGSAASIGVAIAAGAAGGAAGALTGALLNGSNIGQIAKTTFTGAFWGGLSGAANNLAGKIDGFWLKLGAHTLSEGTMEGLQGGNMLHGFMMGATSSLGGSIINKSIGYSCSLEKCISSALLGGVISEIGGGKFANGAITSAFSYLFNDKMHKYTKRRHFVFQGIGQVAFSDNPACDANLFFKIKAEIIETYYPNSQMTLDGYAILGDIDSYNVTGGLELSMFSENGTITQQYFTNTFHGTTLLPKGYSTLGEVHLGINLAKFKTVNVKLKASWSVYDVGMGRATPTVPLGLNVVPLNALVGSKRYKIK